MPCVPCWQQRQLFMTGWQQRNPFVMMQATRRGIAVATDKLRGIDVNRKYGGGLAQDSGKPRPSLRVR